MNAAKKYATTARQKRAGEGSMRRELPGRVLLVRMVRIVLRMFEIRAGRVGGGAGSWAMAWEGS